MKFFLIVSFRMNFQSTNLQR